MSRSAAECRYRFLLKLLPRNWRERWEESAVESFLDHLDKSGSLERSAIWFWGCFEILCKSISLRIRKRHPIRRMSSSHTLNDVRYALRMYARSPGQTVVIALTIAVAVGGGAAIYGIVDSLILTKPPYPAPDELVHLRQRYDAAGTYGLMSWANFEDVRDQLDIVESGGVAMGTRLSVSGGGVDPFYVEAFRVDPDFFAMLGVVPHLGGVPTMSDGQREIALGFSVWQSRFGAEESIIGRTLVVDGQDGTVVSVMPPGVNLPYGAQLWMTNNIGSYFGTTRTAGGLWAFARLTDGSTESIDLAQEQASALARGIAQEYPEVDNEFDISVVPLHEEFTRHSSSTLQLLSWAMAALFLITCINVSGVTLARFLSRGREMSVRLSLGAGKWMVARQLLIESVVLSMIGAVVGIAMAWAAAEAANGFLPGSYLAGGSIEPDWKVALVGIALGVFAGIAAALPPIVRIWRGTDFESMRGRGQTTYNRSAGRAMLVAQYSLSLSTLVVTGLLVRTLLAINSQSLGFDPSGLLTVETDVPSGEGFVGFADDEDAIHVGNFQRGLVDAVGVVSGVSSVALAYSLPLSRRSSVSSSTQTPDMSSDEFPYSSLYRIVSEDYFETMRVGLVSGRLFEESDTEFSEPVVVVSRSMANLLGDNPADVVGTLLRPRHSWIGGSGENRWLRVVGVVEDTKEMQIWADPFPVTYMVNDQNQNWARYADIVVRTEGDPARLAANVVEAMRRFDPLTPVGEVLTYDRILSRTTVSQRFRAGVLVALGGFALLLVLVGMYGVTAYGVARRRRELAIRGALGARPRGLLGQASADGFAAIMAGTVIGLGIAWGAGRLVEGMLYGVEAMDPGTTGAAVVILALSVGLATLLPANRATRIDPVTVLQQDD